MAIMVQYHGKGMGTKGGKAFSEHSVRELPDHFAGECDGKTWVNLSSKPGEARKAAGLASPISGLTQEQIDELFAVLPDILSDPAQCIGDGRPDVKALEAASGIKVKAAQRDDLYGLWLEQNPPPVLPGYPEE